MQLSIHLGDASDLAWAQTTVTEHHYLHQPVDPRARPMAYTLRLADGSRVGLVMLGIPHATRCGGWWGYEGLPTQWQVVDLCRIWLHPGIQQGGHWCAPGIVPGYIDRHGQWRPTVATWAIREVLSSVQADRVRLWPPVYPEQPYHIELAISYHDPQYHRGTIYRESRATPMYVDRCGNPKPGEVPAVEDCGFRMLQPHEIQAAMAFPADYVVTGNKREKVKQLGNAVTPPVMAELLKRVMGSLA